MKAFAGLLLVASTFLTAAAPSNESAVREAIARSSDQTMRKLALTGASWKATITIGPATINVDAVVAPGARFGKTFSVQAAGQTFPLGRIIETPDVWYADAVTGPGKYRPFEAPFALPTTMLFRSAAEARVAGAVAAEAKFVKVECDVATFAFAVPPPQRQQLENLLKQMQEMGKAHPELLRAPENAKRIDAMKSMLADGVPLRIDTSTGIIVESTNTQMRTTVSDFKIASPPDDALDVSKTKWADHTSDPTAGDVNDLMMFGFGATWKAGQPAGDLEGVLLNRKTGELRRLPAHSPQATPGCFLPGRKSIVVSVADPIKSDMGLEQIDLVTHKSRRLGANLLNGGFSLGPVVSPDGKTLAVLFKDFRGKILDERVVLVDLTSGQARFIGEPSDSAFLSWLPDGSGLVLMDRSYKNNNLDEELTETIVRLDLNGKKTSIRQGNEPLVVANNSILYRERKADDWFVCDLSGKNEKRVGDGLKKHAFASSSPDGKQVLMMKFVGASVGPAPVVIDLASGAETPVNVMGGLWAMPAWK